MWQNRRINKFKPRLLALGISAILLTGCAGTVSECPPLVQYSIEFNQQLADEVDTLISESTILRAVADYMTLRDMIRACR